MELLKRRLISIIKPNFKPSVMKKFLNSIYSWFEEDRNLNIFLTFILVLGIMVLGVIAGVLALESISIFIFIIPFILRIQTLLSKNKTSRLKIIQNTWQAIKRLEIVNLSKLYTYIKRKITKHIRLKSWLLQDRSEEILGDLYEMKQTMTEEGFPKWKIKLTLCIQWISILFNCLKVKIHNYTSSKRKID